MARHHHAHGNSDPEHRSGEHWPARMPAPDAHEGGESTWEQWQEASRRLDFAFAPTEPSGQMPLSTGGALADDSDVATRHHLLNAHSLMVVARRNNRVCPRPTLWAELYRQLGGERHPEIQAPPVQAWLWPQLSGLQKRLRFREYVEWAERHGRLDQIARFMRALEEADWEHMGES